MTIFICKEVNQFADVEDIVGVAAEDYLQAIVDEWMGYLVHPLSIDFIEEDDEEYAFYYCSLPNEQQDSDKLAKYWETLSKEQKKRTTELKRSYYF